MHACSRILRRLASAPAHTHRFLLLQTHGFPKVMGVLTHLDSFKDQKRLKKTKKTLKHRFWAEIYQGGQQARQQVQACSASITCPGPTGKVDGQSAPCASSPLGWPETQEYCSAASSTRCDPIHACMHSILAIPSTGQHSTYIHGNKLSSDNVQEPGCPT